MIYLTYVCVLVVHCQGAAVVIVADLIPERLNQAKSFGCHTVNVASSVSVQEQVRNV